jgi:hypothetical protein
LNSSLNFHYWLIQGSTLPKATDYHRRPMRLFNAALRAVRPLGLARFDLDPANLLATARRETGLEDFGDDAFIEPMTLLVRSLEEEAELNPIGRFMARANCLRILKHRLYVQDLVQKHPEILERELGDPVVVVGLARSGTTRLHRLLAADQRFLHLKSWESVYPVPWPESFAARDAGETDPRIAALEQALKAVLYMSPQIAAVHPLGTFEVEEEVGLIQHGFASQLFEIQVKIPSFAEWLMTHEQSAAYDYMVVLLKIIAWWRNDPPGKPWILKTPQYMQDLDELLRVFPDARLIFPHRDPVKVTGSTCSMVWNAIVRDSDSITPAWVGQEWLDKIERMLHKTLKIREEQVAPENQYDVQYADITADWRRAMAGVYDFLDLPLTDQALAGMQDWLESNARHKYGAHRYSLSEFGLQAEAVDQRLMFYRERFAIPYETTSPHLAAASPAGESP